MNGWAWLLALVYVLLGLLIVAAAGAAVTAVISAWWAVVERPRRRNPGDTEPLSELHTKR